MIQQTITSRERIKMNIENFFILFIFIQPLLDITVYMGLQISNPIRVLALLIGCLYIFFYSDKKNRWLCIGYFLVLGIFMALHLVNNLSVKDPYFFSEELTYAVKSAYIASMIVIYAAVFASYKKNPRWSQIVQKVITVNVFFIGLVMVLATITDSGKRSYSMLAKSGHSGWFFSANEISAILAMGFGIMLLYTLGRREIWKKMVLLPLLFVSAWSMLTLGTKVGLLSLMGLLGVELILSLLELIFKRKNVVNVVILITLLASASIYLPYSDVGNNLHITFSETKEPSQSQNPTPSNGNTQTGSKEDIKQGETSNTLVKKALSGRDFFFRTTLNDFKEAPLSQKLLGMGPGGNYEKRLKLIEMDFLDWFFSYGFVGFSLLILPILFLGLATIKNLFQNRFRQMDSTFIMVAIEVGLALGISFLAGHIFLNPASGIYFAILLSYLFVLSTERKKILVD